MNKFIKTSLLALTTIAAITGFLFACEKTEPETFASYESAEFLQLSPKANLNDFSTLTAKDRMILKEACQRLRINDLSPNEKFKINSGKEVNISEDIFDYFYNAHSANFKGNRKRKKAAGESPIPDSIKCSQFVIHDILAGFGKNVPVDDITNWCYINGYFDPVNGTPDYMLPYILEHYFNSPKQCSASSLPQFYTRSGAESYIVVLKDNAQTTDGQPTGHVARLDLYTGIYMYCSSSQYNKTIEVKPEDVVAIYYVDSLIPE